MIGDLDTIDQFCPMARFKIIIEINIIPLQAVNPGVIIKYILEFPPGC